jgi:hypothetical protein
MSAVSVQEMVRPSEPVDLYYYDAETSKKQAFPTTQNTKYVQQFANLTGGSSVFTIPPQNGIQDVVCTFQFNAPGLTTGLALPSGWGYALIRQVSFRYGGSSQYFITGQQLLQNALRCQTSRSSCDDLLNLGGNYSVGADLAVGAAPLLASIVLRLPHNVCSGVGKSHPLPTDCLTQQVQITVELNQPGTIWTNLAGATLPSACQALAFASFQVQQVMLNNQGDALARRVDLATKAYAFPCEFVQQEVVLPATSSSIVLTGFRSGEVKSIEIWLTDNADTVSNSTNGSVVDGYNPFAWYPPRSVEMLYAGDVYARYDLGVGQLFNLINGNKSPAFDQTYIERGVGNLTSPRPFLAQWLSLPFAQTLVDEDAHYILVHGKPITNGIVNLQNVEVPYVSAAGWTLHVSYVYNTTLLFSQGTCDYVF